MNDQIGRRGIPEEQAVSREVIRDALMPAVAHLPPHLQHGIAGSFWAQYFLMLPEGDWQELFEESVAYYRKMISDLRKSRKQ